MDITFDLRAPCPPNELVAWVDDLAKYPAWLTIVTRAEPFAGTDPPAWSVDLRGRVGPFARSKRLRMVRTEHLVGRMAAFERREDDGRQHAPWAMRAMVTSDGDGSHLAMQLHYGGAFWGPVLERLLTDEVDQARGRLLTLVSAPAR